MVQRLRELGGPGLVMCGDPGEGPVVGGQRAALLIGVFAAYALARLRFRGA